MIEISQYEMPEMFPSEEGLVDVIYGLIRSGKTYLATAKIHEEIAQGKVVYATWPIHLEDTDDRKSILMLLRGLLFPWKKRFFYIPASKNFHYINASEGTVDGVATFLPNDNESYIRYLNTLNHCFLYIDEAWRILAHQLVGSKNIAQVFDLILVTGHKFRKVTLITQRTINVNPTARAQVGRFFKCEKLGSIFGFQRFMMSEFQEMKGEDVIDDDPINHPAISVQTYWGSRKIFDSYNSWYYGDMPPVHAVSFQAYDLTYFERILALFGKPPLPSPVGDEVRGVERSEGGKGGTPEVASLRSESASGGAVRAIHHSLPVSRDLQSYPHVIHIPVSR